MKYYFIMILSVLILSATVTQSQEKELEAKRTYFSSTYLLPNDKYKTVISIAPMHYKDKNDKFQKIITDFVPSDTEYDYEVSRGLYHVFFKSDLLAEYPVVFELKDGVTLKMKLLAMAYMDNNKKNYKLIESVHANPPIVHRNVIEYQEAFTGVNVRYSYGPTRLKEDIVMSSDTRAALPEPSSFDIPNKDAMLVFVSQLDFDAAPMVYAEKN